jgi:uncharacterized repeat protein (TIGR03837 family)
MRWDLFCRVVDNFGDVGVCWRLAADLASRGERVRLWIDDPSALAWMAAGATRPVEIVPWREPLPPDEPGEVVVEAFGCDPPEAFVARMAARAAPPVWINLEHLSAEPYVQRCHGLRSPQLAGPGRGLDKWFFYPGFGEGTGGLIREPGLLGERLRFDAAAWLRGQGIEPLAGERRVALFCYDGAPIHALLDRLADAPTLLLLTRGPAQLLAAQALAEHARPGLRSVALPWLAQPDFDRLLWACDLNLVRGEDSFVRAMWAGAPFVWQIYRQDDGAHAAKLEAFLETFLRGVPQPAARSVAALWRAWNGLGPWPAEWPDATAWRAACAHWREAQAAMPDLGTQLHDFAKLAKGKR